MINIKIQKAEPENAREIQNVFYKTWLKTFPNQEIGVTTEDIEAIFKDVFSSERLDRFSQRLSNIPENELFLVAKDNDKVVGICRLIKKVEFNQLQAIYVLPEYQGKGIGKNFWLKIEIFFGQERDILVQVATYNNQAIQFYKRIGFVDTGKRLFNEKLKMPISGVIIPEIEMVIEKTKKY